MARDYFKYPHKLNPEFFSHLLPHPPPYLELQVNYRNRMKVVYFMNYSEENNTTSYMMTDEKIIERVMGNDQEDVECNTPTQK